MERTRLEINRERAAEFRLNLEACDPIERSEVLRRLRAQRGSRRVPARWSAYHGEGDAEAG